MGLGAIFVSVAVLIVVLAYVAWPFRRDTVDGDRVIEAWIERAKSERARSGVPAGGAQRLEGEGWEVAAAISREETAAEVQITGSAEGAADEAINFCPYCGRRVEPDHRFCPKCGRQLVKGEVA
jgi:hypothetical protein